MPSTLVKPEEMQKIRAAVTPRMTKFIREAPTPKQTAFLLLNNLEAFYGGSAGSGKSSALLMAALQYMDIPGYNAIIFRRTYSDLALPGALLDRARSWLHPFIAAGEVRWSEKDKAYSFPSGAKLSFGYLEHDNDRFRYQSAEFQYVGFDELTQFSELQYRYLFSRLRRLRNSQVPIRMRAASNPGGLGHEWVKQRFIVEGPDKGRIFIPAWLEDNPYLDTEEYEESLAQLDPVTRAQLRMGDWDIKASGNLFKRGWFRVIDREELPKIFRWVRYWDMAATEPAQGKDPDWTVGLLLGERRGIYYIVDIVRVRATPHQVESLIQDVAQHDGKHVNIWIEQEPGSSGIHLIDKYSREVLKGYAVRGYRSTGSKILRANPVSSAAEGGRIYVVRAPWNTELFDELEVFPTPRHHDDQVDALSGAVAAIGVTANLLAIPTGVGTEQSYWEGAG